MTSPDVVVTWPRNCDYPLWRRMIRDNREKFASVTVVFMETNWGHDYREFVRTQMAVDAVSFLESPIIRPGEDWRNVAVNIGLMYLKIQSKAEWVWFTEQDFFPKAGFWEDVFCLMQDHMDYIGVKENDRLHPCSLFIKKEVLERTSRNFGIVPNVSDHFSIIQKELEVMDLFRAIQSPLLYTHMAGLSHNMSLLERGEAPNHNVEEFIQYMKECMECGLVIDDYFRSLYRTYINL